MLSLTMYNITRSVSLIFFLLTLFTSSIQLYLTIFKVQKIGRIYRHLLITFSCLGLFFSAIDVIAHPFVHSYKNCFIFFTINPFFDEIWRNSLLRIFGSTYCMLFSMLTIQFIYRYWLLIGDIRKLKLFQGYKLSIWLLATFLNGVICYYLLGLLTMTSDSWNYISDVMKDQYNIEVQDNSAFIYLIDNVKFEHYIFAIYVLTTLGAQYAIMIYCGFRTHYKLNQQVHHFCPQNLRIQKQLFDTLVRQITIPSIIFDFPVLFVYIIPFFNTNINIESGILIGTLNFFNLIDSMIFIYSVSEYWEYVTSKFH
ncbi:unnamed protein product [Caenorhabditis angaria]|uniref:Seven TM Receptor n=1 Tax=Caenorhabditis angaria TaxID=860376 RepID=A0A9P1IYX2_9PELO|nr:unnamed protein product [Caenorhabditis angaria]